MDITLTSAYTHLPETAALFSEYTDMLIANDSTFEQYLDIQNYDREIEHLEEKFGFIWQKVAFLPLFASEYSFIVQF